MRATDERTRLTTSSTPLASMVELSSVSSENRTAPLIPNTASSAENVVNCWARLFENSKQFLKIHPISTLLISAAVALFIAAIASIAKTFPSTTPQQGTVIGNELTAFFVLLIMGALAAVIEESCRPSP